MISYCSACGHPVVRKIPADDNVERDVCEHCGSIHYKNPLIVVGCVVESADGRILLCKRAIEPRMNYWTIPAGFMELGETIEDGARRETQEEALAEVEIDGLLAVASAVHTNQVHITFRTRLVGDFGAGTETIESRLFEEKEIPWERISFPSVDHALRSFLADRNAVRLGSAMKQVETKDIRSRLGWTAHLRAIAPTFPIPFQVGIAAHC